MNTCPVCRRKDVMNWIFCQETKNFVCASCCHKRHEERLPEHMNERKENT